MLTLQPKAWWSWDFQVLEGGREIAFLDRHPIRERASFTWDGASYQIRRTSFFGSTFDFERDGQVIARAAKPSRLRRTFEIRAGPELWTLKASSAFRRAFELERGSVPLGSVRPTSMLRRVATVDLDPGVPVPLQIFVACLVLVLWKRQSDAATTQP